MVRFQHFGLIAAVLTLGACSLSQSYSEVNALNKAEATGSPFTQQLTSEYRAYSNYLMRTMKDYADALHFARKGLSAASGENVMPEPVNDWDLTTAEIPPVSDGRARLVAAIDRGARDIIPGKTAVAQARFDCWIEQTEASVNDTGKQGALSCQQQFAAAMDEVEAALGPVAPAITEAPAAVPAPVGMMAPEAAPMELKEAMYLVFFDFDSSTVGQGGAGVLDAVVAEFKKRGATKINVVGHTDRSGPDAYNDRLAMRRAEAVRKALAERGIPVGSVSTSGRGENELLVQTSDGVREPANRRAVLTFE